MDEVDLDIKSPMKRLGSTRKLLVFSNIRAQLNEQLRWLDARVEAQVALASELQEFFRRRAEVELDYSRGLDKLAKGLQLRHKEQRNKREQWPLFSSYSCYQQLVSGARALARDHATLAELHSTHLVSRLATVMEDVQRIYRRCREIAYETHEEILRVLHELHAAMKTFQQYGAEWRAAEAKLRGVEAQRARLTPAPPPSGSATPGTVKPASKKAKALDKEIEKRKIKYTDAKLKALKARNEYLLCLEASNTTIHKYFIDDVSDLIDCMDLGFHNCISRALRMQVTADEGRARALHHGADALTNCINALDSRLDKQKFVEAHHTAFGIPKKLTFQGPNEEECDTPQIGQDGVEDSVSRALRGEMEARLAQLDARVRHLRTESDEVWKTLETAEATLLQMVDAKDWDANWMFGEQQNGTSGSNTPGVNGSGGSSSVAGSVINGLGSLASSGSMVSAGPLTPKQPEQIAIKARADRQETEDFYLTKFREYLLGSSRIARLEAKGGFLRGKIGCAARAGAPPALAPNQHHPAPRHRKRIGRGSSCQSQPRLFAGSLEEYLETTGQELPLIVTSCIRVINLYGLHHQGIFRVSGSQVEIGALREWFERGADPLASVNDASDINSVAGVLKLYLRELREPLFPIVYFEHYIDLAQLESKTEFVQKMREFVCSMPRCVMVLLRYLFAFLNHLAEFSEENMMDPWNLAICFGPTLIPVPDDKDQVQYQNQINDLIKNIIILHEEIFPRDVGLLYEKYQTPPEQEVDESPLEAGTDDVDSEASLYPSEDEADGGDLVGGGGIIWETGPGERPAQCWRREAPHTPDSYTDIHIKDEGSIQCSISSDSLRRRVSSSTSDSAEGSANHGRSPQSSTLPPHTWPRQESLSSSVESREEDWTTDQKSPSDDSRVPLCDDKGTAALSESNGKAHTKSHSLGESTVPFSLNRELWQQRASSTLKHTPDLVMDLPGDGSELIEGTCPGPEATSNDGKEDENGGGTSPVTAAERFAHNQHTLKKRVTRDTVDKESTCDIEPSHEKPIIREQILKEELSNEDSSKLITPSRVECQRSPVPPRNTQRVAAKFADLTLTGGSLKPQIAAKPMVFRKPTSSSTSEE